VLVSTTYSKSVLRVAAETLSRGRDWVEYFPSYEIITGAFNQGRYLEGDLREVNVLGVRHAMRCFFENFVDGGGQRAEPAAAAGARAAATRSALDIVCDEIDRKSVV
jgi:hypothetical protein